MPAAPALTVVIPTYRRTASLLRTLASLQEQDVAGFELLVMDNAADAALRDAIDGFNESARVPARWIPEPAPGVHRARNTGARHATSPLLAYTDDDVTFAPGWARSYIDAFAAYPEMDAAGGPSHADWESPPPAWLLALVNRRPAFFQLSLRDFGPAFRLDETESFWSLNMAIRKDALVAHGGFNPELVGDHYVGDGEGGLFRKMCRTGARVAYVPGALVHHRIPAHRMTMAYLRHRMRNEGASETYAALRRTNTATPHVAATIVTNGLGAIVVGTAAACVAWSEHTFARRLQLKASELRGRSTYAWNVLRDDDLRRMIHQDTWI